MEWNPISKRIIKARFYSQYRIVIVIQVYEPHNEKDEDKEQFYTELQETLDSCSQNDLITGCGAPEERIDKENLQRGGETSNRGKERRKH